ncbi:MAG: hypothetical protein LUE93_13380 [Bacteroides sp.]|nr:hypothetical protein [Bacteroides sp.]
MHIYDGVTDIEFSLIEQEYTLPQSILADPPQVLKILNELPLPQRRLLILYAELRSVRKIARIYHCSKDVIANEINEIRKYYWKRVCG